MTYLAWIRIAALASVGCGLIASCAGDDGSKAPATEACNGIDDNGDGLIDEGCACQPFSVEVPFRVTAAVSIGNSWALATTTDLHQYPGALAQAGYARVDGSGTVLDNEAQLDGLFGSSPQPFAWNGRELTYVLSSDTDSHIATIAPDGTPGAAGPSLGLARLSSPAGPAGQGVVTALIVATPTGFQIAGQVAASNVPLGVVASTDASGAPQPSTAMAIPGGGPQVPYHLDLLAGQPTLVWRGHDTELDPFYVSRVATLTPNRIFEPAAIASSGDEVLIFDETSSHVQHVYDGTAVSTLALDVDGLTAAWTGDHYEIAAAEADHTLAEVQLSRDHVVMSTTPLPAPSGSQLYNTVVAADASHALFGRFYAVGGVTHQVLTQVCP